MLKSPAKILFALVLASWAAPALADTPTASPTVTATFTVTAFLSPTPTFPPICTGPLTWTQMNFMPQATGGASATTLGNTIYVLAPPDYGNAPANFYAYNPLTDVWTQKATPTQLSSGGALAAANGLVYAFSGSVTLAYDPGSDTWTQKAAMNAPRTFATAATAQGLIFVIGGNSANGSTITVEAYDPVADSWSVRSPYPNSRPQVDAVAINGVIYLVNGLNEDEVDVYNPGTDTWSTPYQNGNPQYGDGRGAAVLGQFIVIAGAEGVGSQPAELAYRYDITNNQYVRDTPPPFALAFPAMASYGGFVYVFGGQSKSADRTSNIVVASVFKGTFACSTPTPTPAATPCTGSLAWSQIASLPDTQAHSVAAVSNGLIYEIGQGSQGNLGFYAYDPSANTWAPKTLTSALPGVPPLAEAGGTLYAFFGNTVAAYSTASDSWSFRAAPTNLSSAEAAVNVNGVILVVGGASYTAVNYYDPYTNNWGIGSFGSDKTKFSLGSDGNRNIFAIDGLMPGNSNASPNPVVDQVDQFDAALDRSATVEQNALYGGAFGRATASLQIPFLSDATFFTVGGTDASGNLINQADRFIQAANARYFDTPYPLPVAFASAVYLNGAVYVMGGTGRPAGSGVDAPLNLVYKGVVSCSAFVPPTASPTQTPTATWTPAGALTATPSPSLTALVTLTPTPTPTASPTVDPSTSTPTISPTFTVSPIVTPSATLTQDLSCGGTGKVLSWNYIARGPAFDSSGTGFQGSFYAVSVNTLWVYDPPSGTWTTKGTLPLSEGFPVLAGANGLLYVIGQHVQAYDPVANTWTQKQPMNFPRNNAGAAVVNGLIYVVGGEQSATVESYNPSTNIWTVEAPMPVGRGFLGVAAVNGIIYAVSGENCTAYPDCVADNVEAYDPSTNAWTEKNPGPDVYGLSAAVIRNTLYVLGGFTRPTEHNAVPWVFSYNPGTDTWKSELPMEVARNFFAAGAVNDTIYVAGGETSPWGNRFTDTDTAERGDFECPVSPSPTFSSSPTPSMTLTPTSAGSSTATPTPTPTSQTSVFSPTPTCPFTATSTPTQHPTCTCPTTPQATDTPSSNGGGIVIGPVPAHCGDRVHMVGGGDVDRSEWRVFSADGRRVASQVLGSQDEQSLNTGGMAPGVYLVWIEAHMADGSTRRVLQKIALVP